MVVEDVATMVDVLDDVFADVVVTAVLALVVMVTAPSAVEMPSHAARPSIHVCSKFDSSGSPHFLNQAPPRAQQLRLPVLAMVPHLGHGIVVA